MLERTAELIADLFAREMRRPDRLGDFERARGGDLSGLENLDMLSGAWLLQFIRQNPEAFINAGARGFLETLIQRVDEGAIRDG